MSKMYRAKSLDDIAKTFRDIAKGHEAKMNASVVAAKRNHYAGEVVAWNAAATMLEQTEIVGEE